MQASKRVNFIRNLLVLASLIGVALAGWLAGHILRFSIPALWHPPIRETDPQIENGYQFKFEGEPFVLPLQENPWVRAYIGGVPVALLEGCPGNTYYMSLPAKCCSFCLPQLQKYSHHLGIEVTAR